LFNIRKDPDELSNVYDTHITIADELNHELVQWETRMRLLPFSDTIRSASFSAEEEGELRSLGYL